MKKLSIMNWIVIASVIASVFVHYFMFREDTQGGFAETKIADVQTIAEIDKLKIRIENLELSRTVNDRDKQNLRKEFNEAVNKIDSKLNNIYNILIK